MPAFHSRIPEIRRRFLNSCPLQRAGDYVLYWMTMQRRPTFNFALQRAVEWAIELQRPLVILEALRRDYAWASRRLHEFLMQGMQANEQHFAGHSVYYYPYLEEAAGDGKGLLESLAQRACLVVGDDFPCFFLPRMLETAASRLNVPLEVVDGNGLLPLRSAPKVYERAVDFRRFLQKSLAAHLTDFPTPDPLAGLELPRWEGPLPQLERWPARSRVSLEGLGGPPEVGESGGFRSADRYLTRFLEERLDRYDQRSQPSLRVSSELSPYLHFGHLSVHQVFQELSDREDWSISRMRVISTGSKDGSWGLSAQAEGFLDELITWRELGYNFCHYRSDYDRYESLPPWARATLEEHADDPRPILYTHQQLEQGQTHDALWNAAQRQLREEGRMHNYLRMLWGKKILEWSPHPRQALEVMIELNNRYALDGRNPNSYSGIFWCLGRYDRPWFERPIFGTIRYMSSDATARKFPLRGYLDRWGSA